MKMKMKKFLIVLAFLLVVFEAGSSAAAVTTWVSGSSLTVGWNAITTFTDGTTIPSGDVIKYDVYYKPDGATAPPYVKVTTSPIAALSYIVAPTAEGKFNIGVVAIRFNSAGTQLSSSDLSWSDIAANCQGGQTFGLNFYKVPTNVIGLRPQ
jgi:hypothetical protein